MLFAVICAPGQELFPVFEQASTVPKGVIGLRATDDLHYKYKVIGHREILRILYGVTHNFSLIVSPSFSNFHVSKFPDDLNYYYAKEHNHQSGSSNYPYTFEGVHLLTKWRFLSLDGKNEHLRFSLINELSYSRAVHLDAYPNLLGDNSGWSAGLIVTKLKKKFALSATTAFAYYFPYSASNNGSDVKFNAGNSLNLNVSMGYLVFPRTYTSYHNLNVNLYVEGQYKVYGSPIINRDGTQINSDQFKYLKPGSLFRIYPGVQLIVNSKTRIDFSMELPVYYSNDLQRYGTAIVSWQRYFF